MNFNDTVYKCYYCEEKSHSFSLAIKHTEEVHPSKEIKLRKRINVNGKYVYQSKHLYGYVPETIFQDGKSICVDEDKEVVYLVPDQNSTPQNDNKRHKASVSTPNEKVPSRWKSLFPESEQSDRREEDKLDDVRTIVTNSQTQTVPTSCIDLSDLNENDRDIYTTILQMIPSVIDNFKKAGLLTQYIKFCNLVSSGNFNLRQISHLLFLDVVEFMSAGKGQAMRYNFPETLKFWRVGYKLFHGRFIRFMGGPKYAGKVLEGVELLPETAGINFAVSHKQILLKEESGFLKESKPGIIETMIEAIAQNSKFSNGIKLTVDAKKIKKGFGSNRGEIDLDGMEDSPTIKERHERLQQDLDLIRSMKEVLNIAESENRINLIDFNDKDRRGVVSLLQDIVVAIGKRTEDLRKKI